MQDTLTYTLRCIAAGLMTLSGLAHVASLWFRPITDTALLDVILGGVYLIVGIGLFGRSRFSLCVAIVLPATLAAFFVYTLQEPGPLFRGRIAVDTVVAVCSAIALWRLRNNPST